MGFEIKDLDLAVDLPNGGVKFARWLQKKRLTSGRPIFFMKFGTAKLRLRRFPDDEIELVQTRREQYTRETSRCPEVCFGSIEDDCYRRDFTVNSLYYDITRDRMVDITGKGIPDMKAGLLRTPLDPDDTFNDDPVRILRGLRFANRFDWAIDPPVYEALLRHIDRLEIVSRERCHSELCKMINGPAPVKMMQTLRETGALAVMIPELEPLTRSNMLWNAAMERLDRVIAADPEAPTRFRLASLMIDLRPAPREAAKAARKIMTDLRFDRPIVADVAFLVMFAGLKPEMLDNPRRVREVQNLAMTPERMELLVRYIADLGRPEDAAGIKRISDRVTASGQSGYMGSGNRHKSPTASAAEAPRRRHRRGGRRRRRGRETQKKQ